MQTMQSDTLQDKKEANSTLVSKNITVDGHRTSVRLEPEMWCAFKEIAHREQCSIHDICTLISKKKSSNSSLTAAIRVFLMLYYRSAATEKGHLQAGHGNFGIMQARAEGKASAIYKDQPQVANYEGDILVVNARNLESEYASA